MLLKKNTRNQVFSGFNNIIPKVVVLPLVTAPGSDIKVSYYHSVSNPLGTHLFIPAHTHVVMHMLYRHTLV